MRIYIVLGHPTTTSFNGEISNAYEEKVKRLGHEVRRHNIGEMQFNLNLSKTIGIEKDVKEAQDNLSWCDHLVIIYPMWWGSYPAILKGYIDRVLTPGFAYKYHKGSPLWDKLLKGKSATIISTCDAPALWARIMYKDCDFTAMRKAILGFCGIHPIMCRRIGSVRYLTQKQRNTILKHITVL